MLVENAKIRIETHRQAAILYFAVWSVYSLYFHPLSRCPGPKLAAISPIIHILWDIRGKEHSGLFVKDPALYSPTPNGTNAMITANNEEHTRMRRLLTHAFSNKALKEQDQILHVYADMLIDKLAGIVRGSQHPVVDMTRWYNFTTFNLIGDLPFGEPFGCLSDNKYHCPKTSAQEAQGKFTSCIIKHGNGGRGLSLPEIDVNAGVFVLAGSETTAALLTGCTYYLLRHPEKYVRLVSEIRGAFAQISEIKLSALVELPYLNAVLTKILRIYSPIPFMLPRLVPQGGAVIDGQYVPGRVSVSISLFLAFHSNTNFNNPDSFILSVGFLVPSLLNSFPIKRMHFDHFHMDHATASVSTDAEMRLILAKFLWHFDLELQVESLFSMVCPKLLFPLESACVVGEASPS
ncbi:Cytochrome P450 [Penicillium subrubescens]|uniref:Cytochrome P450 n=1 Tax=Penicillium subrubescens TaxID=1316194 RepID=UPI0025453495|nr:Cytochrome P450 [Penicillium subrubescens]KAJ5911230.1 Cytochrome P450 [Penicillium subrubescens]